MVTLNPKTPSGARATPSLSDDARDPRRSIVPAATAG